MSGIHGTIFGGVLAAMLLACGSASASPGGLGAGGRGAVGQVTLVGHSHGGAFGGGGVHFSGRSGGIGAPRFSGHSNNFHANNFGGARFHGSPRFYVGPSRGPVRFSGNWSNHSGRHHHRHGGYPFIGYYGGGYYPYYEDYWADDYSYEDSDTCYYRRRLHARVCPDE